MSSTPNNRRQRPRPPPPKYPPKQTRRLLVNVIVHLVTLAIYILPILPYSEPTLDEMHILDDDNADINGPNTSLTTIWHNDYWGRPLTSHSSHKSWRPLSILLFRHVRGGWAMHDLLTYRLINVLTHSAVAELVSTLGLRLLQSNSLLLKTCIKLMFALHPTHVEVTVNAANRPHLLSLLCALVASYDITSPVVFWLCLVGGFLSCETFLFQTLPILGTLVLLRKNRLPVGKAILLSLTTILYLWFRFHNDSLSIPEGLIRPAENPFFELSGWTRIWSYLYVLTIHVYKQWDFDIIGFSHEYGHACITPIHNVVDARLYAVWVLVWLHMFVFMVVLLWSPKRIKYLVFYVIWTATLFPISGIIKVGTFVSDRMVVPASVPTSIFYGYLAFLVSQRRTRLLLLPVGLGMWCRLHARSLDWMSSKSLLESSLKTCPDFAKAHMELSKLYSGMDPKLFDLKTARKYLNKARQIDPDFCDLHQQFAIVSMRENRLLEFERELVESLQCKYTMGGAIPMWEQYWRDPSIQANPAAQKRRESYAKTLDAAIKRAQREETEKEEQQKQQPRHPFAWKR